MPVSQYLITINSNGCTAKVKAKYRDGKFRSLELLSGTFPKQTQFEALMKLTPQLENVIIILQQEFKGRVTWEKITTETESLYRKLLDEYIRWYSETVGLPYKFTGVDGNAMKSIETFLRNAYAVDADIEKNWTELLCSFEQLPEFYRNQKDLRQINSNMNVIIRHLAPVNNQNLNDEFSKIING